VTARPNTERPVTITHGTNRLVDCRREAVVAAVHDALASRNGSRPTGPPELWDGRAAERIADELWSADA
jgi:UDP-N-acetylglucosamine 2-epimerase (non-hydrolysing)